MEIKNCKQISIKIIEYVFKIWKFVNIVEDSRNKSLERFLKIYNMEVKVV